jgi:hypothetical protein
MLAHVSDQEHAHVLLLSQVKQCRSLPVALEYPTNCGSMREDDVATFSDSLPDALKTSFVDSATVLKIYMATL